MRTMFRKLASRPFFFSRRNFTTRDNVSFTRTHEFLRLCKKDGLTAEVGLTRFGAERLGEVVFVDVGEIGKKIKPGEPLASLESVKSVGEIYSPVHGQIIGINPRLLDKMQDFENSLGLVNTDPEGNGWLVTLKANNVADLSPETNSALLSLEQYVEHCAAETEKETEDINHLP